MPLLSDYHQAREMNAYAATLPRIKIPSVNTHPMMTRSKKNRHMVFTPVLSPMDVPAPASSLVPPMNRLYAVASEVEDHSKCGKNCSLRQFTHWPSPAMMNALSTIVPEVHTPIIESGAAGGSTMPSPKPAGTSATMPKVFTRQTPPTWEEYCAMDSNEIMRWECLVCGEPAIAGSYQPGRLCSSNCAYIKYTV